MATTFNFTVRAEDDQGAFADREFSIKVRNTVVDRYMITDSVDAYTSPDLVNWTKRANQGGYAVNYGGGKWMVTVDLNTATYRISTDGVNFETRSLTTSIAGLTGLAGILVDHEIIWHNGYWWVHCRATSIGWTGYKYFLIKSSDGLTWNTVAEHNLGQASSTTPTIVGDEMFIVVNSAIYSINTTTGTTSPFSPNLPAMNLGTGTITILPPYRINGLWIFPRHSITAFGSYYSADRINWYAGEIASSHSGRTYDRSTYINGVIFAQYRLTAASSGSGPLMSSDGKKWTTAATGFSSAINSGTKCFIFMTKGKVHFILGAGRRTSSDLGETWEEFTLPMANVTGFAMIR